MIERDSLGRTRSMFPNTADALRASPIFNQWWYYTTELLPSVVAKGIYAPDMPHLPRILMRSMGLQGQSCLDMGSMEGLMPVLMHRGGAKNVLAIDFDGAQLQKLNAVRHYYGASFDFMQVGLMYDLSKKLAGKHFDFVNCSGLLYHVMSPMHVLMTLRSLVKKGGAFMLSTNVVFEPGFTMEFNNAGRLQRELNTFWYISVPLLDYMLRLCGFYPLSCLYVPHKGLDHVINLNFDKPSAYMSVLCLAGDTPLPTADDKWMGPAARESWEIAPVDWAAVRGAPMSDIKIKEVGDARFFRKDISSYDLWAAVQGTKPVEKATQSHDTHALMLADRF